MQWERLLGSGRGIAKVSDLCASGLSRFTVRTRIRNGTWQQVLPDVVAAQSGPLTPWQRRKAGLLYAGPGSALSHSSAASMLGLLGPERSVEVTVPHGRRRPNRPFVVVHQTLRPLTSIQRDGLPCTPVPRTIVDVSGDLVRIDDVTALVARAVQNRMVTVGSLTAELAIAPRQGSKLVREVLGEVASGSRSAGESTFLRLIRGSHLPLPQLNMPVPTRGGTFYADALWERERLIVEIDGAAWHLDVLSWRRDLRRQNHLINAGYRILRFPVQRLREDPAGVIAEIRAALRVAS